MVSPETAAASGPTGGTDKSDTKIDTSACDPEMAGNNRTQSGSSHTWPGLGRGSRMAPPKRECSENLPASGLVSVPGQVPADDEALNLVGALEDLHHLGLAHVPLDGEVPGVAGPAEHLDRVS